MSWSTRTRSGFTLIELLVVIAIIATYLAIWWTGRYFGKRRYKVAALGGWFCVIAKAGSFGVGHELLIQGDSSGSALLTIGFIAGLAAVFQRI
jgi:prepilin-type N-terminal cleavage/methylation domain-containing protein